MSAAPLHVTPRQRDTILAALRYWQRELPVVTDPVLHDIASEHGMPLTETEIDELCEAINQ